MDIYSIKLGISLDEKSVANIKKELKTKFKDEKIELKIDTGSFDKVDKTVDKINTKLSKTSKDNGLSKTAKTASKDVDKLNKNLDKTEKKIKNANFATDNWAYNWSKAMQSFLTYNTVTQFYNNVVSGMQDMISNVKELDDSLTELKKVTDLEGESLNKFTDEAFKAGKEVAKTGKEMIDAATSFAKSGYDEETSLALGKIAAMYTNIADEEISTADAADFIIAQMKAFNIEAENTMHIIDAVNEVSNNFAVSSADIATNMGKASAVMANAGNSMEQMIGLMTAGTEITRNASKVANGLKTITLRLQGMNDEGEKDLELQAQMEGLFKKLGISVYDANGELKNTYDILATLAPVYKDLTNAEKAYVTETIAGKYQAQNAAAILMNWQTAVDATTTALNSNGSAARENEAVLDSIQGHLQQLESAWQELSRTVFDSNFLKFVIDLGTAFLTFANSGAGQAVTKLAASLMALQVGINIFNKISTSVQKSTMVFRLNTIAKTQNTLADTKLTAAQKRQVTQLLLSKNALDKEKMELTKSTKAKLANVLSTTNLTKAEKKDIMAKVSGAAANGTLTASTFTLKGAVDALTASMLANPITAILVAATALVSVITSITNAIKENNEERQQALKEIADQQNQEYEQSKEELDSQISKYKELKEQLSKNNITQSEALSIKEELLSLQKELNEKYGSEADGLDLVNGKYQNQIDLLNELEKKQAKQFLTENAANINKAPGTITYKSNRLGNLGGISGDNEQFVKNLLKQGTYEFDIEDSRTYAEWFYKQLTNRIESLNKAYLKATNEGNDKVAKQYKKQLEELTTYSQDFKEQAEKSVETVQNAADAYIKSNEVLSDVYDALLEGELDGLKTDSKAFKELEKMKEEGTISDDMANYIYEYMHKMWEDNWDLIAKENEQAAKDSKDSYQKGALGRLESDKGTAIDVIFTSDETTENVKKFYEELKNAADQGAITDEIIKELTKHYDEFSIVNEQLTDSFGNQVGSLEEIRDYFNGVNEDTLAGKDILTNYSTELDSITQKYGDLAAAVDEYNESGYLSLETLQKMMDNNLLQYLSYENGQLVANTEELYNQAEAQRVVASQKLYNAMADDIMNVAEGKLENVSNLAKSAIEGLGNNAETAGNQAANATNKFINFAEAVDLSNKALEGKELTSDIKKNISAVQDAYKPYFDLLSKSVTIEKKKYTGSSASKKGSTSSSKTKEKEWWETAYDNLKDQFDYSEITIEQYINGLENILGKLDKGSDAWRKINKELQKQRLDKVKDDYNAGRISLTQYIKELGNLQKAYAKGTDAWNNLADAIKSAKLNLLKEQQNDLKSALSAVTDVLDDQIDEYEDLRDAAADRYEEELDKLDELKDSLSERTDDYEKAQSAVIKYLNEQLDLINQQQDSIRDYYDYVLDSLDKMNQEQEDALELAEAYEALMNSMAQKTKKVWYEGIGWVWEADQEAIKDAKKNYDDLVKNATIKSIEEQKDKTVSNLEEQIAALESYIESWDNVFDKYGDEKNKNLADLLLGDNWSELVSQLDSQVVDDFSDAYYNLQKNLEDTETQIEELNKKKEEEDKYWSKLIEDVKDYKEQWSDIADIYQEAQDKLKAQQIIGANWEKEILEQRLNVLEDFKNKYNAILTEIDKVEGMNSTNASTYSVTGLPGYANGGEVDYTGLAMLHGTPTNPEYVLNNSQMRTLLSNLTNPKIVSKYSGTNNSVVNNYNFGNIELPNVNNAQQFINELKSLVNLSNNQ